ncbi:MAG TPA: hypothetical protein VHE34_12495 [Puia sp.]|uniref:hypothetical protein n=1 Tax=Puia sp. TaxID=2045100 RepID=UPI002BF22E5E|nr:hypothetical protein [Puia sp.]HVU96042.1 hypothetical protein [Puia sp.]
MLKNLLARLFKKKANGRPPIPKPLVPSKGSAIDHPHSFGYKCNWLAIPTIDTDKLASLFRLTATVPCNWEYGIQYSYEGLFFVSPPVDGWSFIVSRNLPCAEDSRTIELLKDILIDLSTEFGEAQYFGTYRVVGYDCWMKAKNGRLERAYGFVDSANTIVEGDPTPIEAGYNLYNTFSKEFEDDPDYSAKADYPDESITMEIAGAWSINPQDLEDCKDLAPRLGILGVREW